MYEVGWNHSLVCFSLVTKIQTHSFYFLQYEKHKASIGTAWNNLCARKSKNLLQPRFTQKGFFCRNSLHFQPVHVPVCLHTTLETNWLVQYFIWHVYVSIYIYLSIIYLIKMFLLLAKITQKMNFFGNFSNFSLLF